MDGFVLLCGGLTLRFAVMIVFMIEDAVHVYANNIKNRKNIQMKHANYVDEMMQRVDKKQIGIDISMRTDMQRMVPNTYVLDRSRPRSFRPCSS